MEVNTQPIDTRSKNSHLLVHSVWPTIQGEGPHVGRPAVFVRLAGCNLQCPLCDTDYSSRWSDFDPRNLAGFLSTEFGSSLIVLTGGEPMRQDLGVLCRHLLSYGHEVQIETNGTYYQELPSEVMVVCSPKTKVIHPQLQPHFYKYVVQAGYTDDDGLPTMVLGKRVRIARPPYDFDIDRVYIQPADEQDEEKNKANMKEAVDICMKHGYRLCLQMHKIAGLP